MKKLLPIVMGLALAGCQFPTFQEKYIASSDEAGMNVYPVTQGIVDTYRPLYRVDNQKQISNGYGDTEKEAIENAVYNMCTQMKCDYVAAAKWTISKDIACTKSVFLWIITFGHAHDEIYQAKLIGFPVYIDGIQTVKAKFYSQDGDSKFVETEPEHKVIWGYRNGAWGWYAHRLPDGEGEKWNAKDYVLRSSSVDGTDKTCGLFGHDVGNEDRVPNAVHEWPAKK